MKHGNHGWCRVLCLTLLTALLFSCLAAAENADTSEHVDLVMYLIGNVGSDNERVISEISKLAEEDLNASLTVYYIGYAEMSTKYSMLLASGEPVDLIFAGDWVFYAEEAAKSAFVEITPELVKTYMPGTWAEQDMSTLNFAKVNGKTYAIPSTYSDYSAVEATVIRGDLREKYGLEPLETFDDYANYLKVIGENEPSLVGYGAFQTNEFLKTQSFYMNNDIIPIGRDEFCYHYSADTTFTAEQIEYSYFTEEYADWAAQMKTLAESRAWSRNAISNKTTAIDAFENGTAASYIGNPLVCVDAIDQVNETHPEWKAEVYDLAQGHVKYRSLPDMMAVPYSSQHVERALMLLDKLKTDKRYYDLFQYGIEGENWIETSDTQWKRGPSFANYENDAWGARNINLMRSEDGENPLRAELIAKFDETQITPIVYGFRFNEESVKTELASMRSLVRKYGYLLDLGMVDNVDQTLTEFRQALMDAGYEKVMEAYRTQMSEFLATIQ